MKNATKFIDETKKFIDETGEIVTLEEMRQNFYENMTAEEQNEYNNDFEQYLVCCMWWNGGTLSAYSGE